MHRTDDRSVVLGLAMLAASSVTQGARAEEPVRFEYHAPAECPGEEVFARQVAERSMHRQAAEKGEFARTFVVHVTAGAEGVQGRVDFVDPDGRAVFRMMQGATCEEVIAGIALVVALAIDARAASDPADQPTASAPTVAAPSQAAVPPRVVASSFPPPERPRGVPTVEPPSPFVRDFAFGLGSGYSSYEGPSGALMVEGSVGASFAAVRFPARATARYTRSDVVTAGTQRAIFYGLGGRLEGCPPVLGVAFFFAVPCLGTEAGVLRAVAAPNPDLQNPGRPYRGYWNGVFIARLGAVVANRLVLEVAGTLAVPFVRHRFGFGEPPNEALAFQMPSIGAGASAGVGLRFP
jgi:hypothetical protein